MAKVIAKGPGPVRCVYCMGVITQAFIIGGCMTDSGFQPPEPWTGVKPTTTQISATTAPVLNRSTISEFDVGATRRAPEYVIEVARKLMEPKYGTMSYVKSDLKNGRTRHLALTPRFDVGNAGLDYSWIQVDVNFNPRNGWSTVDVIEKRHIWRPFFFSGHGGLWSFPGSLAEDERTQKAKQLLLDIMQHLDDPSAEIGDPIHFE